LISLPSSLKGPLRLHQAQPGEYHHALYWSEVNCVTTIISSRGWPPHKAACKVAHPVELGKDLYIKDNRLKTFQLETCSVKFEVASGMIIALYWAEVHQVEGLVGHRSSLKLQKRAFLGNMSGLAACLGQWGYSGVLDFDEQFFELKIRNVLV